jgi:hypothetical protein
VRQQPSMPTSFARIRLGLCTSATPKGSTIPLSLFKTPPGPYRPVGHMTPPRQRSAPSPKPLGNRCIGHVFADVFDFLWMPMFCKTWSYGTVGS